MVLKKKTVTCRASIEAKADSKDFAVDDTITTTVDEKTAALEPLEAKADGEVF